MKTIIMTMMITTTTMTRVIHENHFLKLKIIKLKIIKSKIIFIKIKKSFKLLRNNPSDDDGEYYAPAPPKPKATPKATPNKQPAKASFQIYFVSDLMAEFQTSLILDG